ncbi:MAG TPA: ribosome small subunit-dependent GTPase A [Longimicrobiales bacterium]
MSDVARQGSALANWGWDEGWLASLSGAESATKATVVGRVTGQDRDRWTVQTESGPAMGRITSRAYPGPFPVTGDWVTVQPGPAPSDPVSISAVLPRRSAIARGVAGGGKVEQVLAANVDLVWIVHGLDRSPNLRRIERYLAVAWESGAIPEIILTKADLASDVANVLSELASVAVGIRIDVVSIAQPDTILALRGRLAPGVTVALLGPSGTGKSTLINALADASMAATGAVRESDRKGRHTTTRRELFQIPGGALLIDTPGLRELRVRALDEGIPQTFPEIEDLAAACRYRDCRHEVEPGCAVLQAVAAGDLDAGRLASFRKLRAEAAYVERKSDPRANAAAVAKHKTALKTLKYHQKYRGDT